MGKVILVTSGKGGTGKTSSTAAIGSALAELGHKVLCFDADMVLRNLDISLCMTEQVVMNFYDVMSHQCTLEAAAVEHPQIENLFLLTAPVNISYDAVSSELFGRLIDSIKQSFDYCLIDCPAGLGAGFRLAAANSDSAVVVSTYDDSSCRDAQRTTAELLNIGIKDISLIVNRVRPVLLKTVFSNIDNIIDSVGAKLIGLVPEDQNVSVCANLGTPLLLAPKSRSKKAFKNIAKRIDGVRVPLMKL